MGLKCMKNQRIRRFVDEMLQIAEGKMKHANMQI